MKKTDITDEELDMIREVVEEVDADFCVNNYTTYCEVLRTLHKRKCREAQIKTIILSEWTRC